MARTARQGTTPTILILLLALLAAACGDEAGTTTTAAAGGDSPTTTQTAEEWEPEYVDGALQPLPDGFPEREITIVNPDEAGSEDGVYARFLDNSLEDISPVPIVVSDEPTAHGGTIAALADTETREGGEEGYFVTIQQLLGVPSDFHVEPITEETGYTLEDIRFLIVTEVLPYVMVQHPDVPWEGGFEAWLEYARENPGELTYLSNGVGSGHDLLMEWLLHELEVEVTKVPTAGNAEAIAAVGAGEGDFTMTDATLAAQAAEEGRVEIIFFSTQDAPPQWEGGDVVTAADYAEYGLPEDAPPWGSLQGLMVPASVPELHVRWLEELFTAATETDTYQQRAQLPMVTIEVMGSDEADESARAIYDATDQIVRDLGLHIDEG